MLAVCFRIGVYSVFFSIIFCLFACLRRSRTRIIKLVLEEKLKKSIERKLIFNNNKKQSKLSCYLYAIRIEKKKTFCSSIVNCCLFQVFLSIHQWAFINVRC